MKIGNLSQSFGSKLIVNTDDGTRFKLMQIDCKRNLRTPEEGEQYVNEMINKYEKKFSEIKNNATVTVSTVAANPFDFEYTVSPMLYEKKDGKLEPYIQLLPFKDKIKQKHPNPDYVLGLQPGVEYPSVDYVLRKAYEMAKEVDTATKYNFIPPVPTLFK